MKKLLITISTCSVLWLAGCATHHTHDGSVARTLDSYQVGTTTFADFKHDAHLHEHRTVMNGVKTTDGNPPQSETRAIQTYDTPRSSHWRIFHAQELTKVTNGNLVTHSRELTVGTPERPLYILTFNQAGVLIDKKPVSHGLASSMGAPE